MHFIGHSLEPLQATFGSWGMSANPIRLVKRYLCVKKLTINDGFTNKSVKLPRAEARFFMGELRNRQAIPLVLLDEDGSCWEFVCTCSGAQYSLSRIGAFCEAHGARPGCYFIFYADHEHIVRLAVRHQLPEDVQAALAAARAAIMAIRSPPQCPASLQQSQKAHSAAAAASNSTASLPRGSAELDDPVVLDEMPPVATCSVAEGLPAAPAGPPVLVPPEPQRVKPLQDRSNHPEGRPPPDAIANGAKLADGGKPVYSIGGVLGTATSGSLADKENDESVLQAGPAGKASVRASTFPVVSSGGLQAPATATATGASRVPLQQQQPPPPSPLLSRSPHAPPSPPPATRLRMRFEARLRAQAGKLHPLSVRTGPESQLPVPPGYCGTNTWSALALHGAFPSEGIASYMSSHNGSLVPCPWGTAGPWGYPAHGFRPDNPAVDPAGLCPPASGHWAVASCLHPTFSGAIPPRQQQHHQGHVATDTSPSAPDPLEPCEGPHTGCPDLSCGELLEWDLGRRAAASGAAAGWCTSWSFAAPVPPSLGCPHPGGYQVHRQTPRPPGPPRDARTSTEPPTSASQPRANLSFAAPGVLRHLLLLQGLQQPPRQCGASGPPGNTVYSGQEVHAPYSGVMRQQQQRRGVDLPGSPLPHSGDQLPSRLNKPQLPSPRSGGGLFPFACSANSAALRQLLNMSGAWDFTAMSGAAGQLGGSTAHSPYDAVRPTASYSPRVVGADYSFQHQRLHQRQRAANVFGGDSPRPPSLAQDKVTGANIMDVDCRTESWEEQQVGLVESLGARPKTSLSIERELERDIPGLPDQLPRCKRQRCDIPRQLLARKVLTAHDLLSDRVALSVAPAVCALLISLLRGDEVAVDGPRADPRTTWRSRRGARNSGDPSGLAVMPFAHELCTQGLTLLGWPPRVPVDVLVESGARYEGLLVLPGPSGSASPREWELQGLRPYLIRRQAGVGDVLTLGVDETTQQADSCLRLVARLQLCRAI
ncbi:hypothetical protein VaNZ11_012943 [Volvox africanus]|uniref:Uncharacterized protein n=1 Tax=Volvox africanus TaxID=51714 RepID=A0ABQ5SF71_9CHLO|nr:hypothetical protein VaNZ11_012943 [Volvox africanus]